jgi:hypothetical protein
VILLQDSNTNAFCFFFFVDYLLRFWKYDFLVVDKIVRSDFHSLSFNSLFMGRRFCFTGIWKILIL